MALNTDAVMSAVESALGKLGLFEQVVMHDLTNAPGPGLHAAVVYDGTRVIPRRSGLAATSALVVLTIRIELGVTTEPKSAIDRDLLKATDAVLNAINGDFDLGSTVSDVDILGTHGVPVGARPGYIARGDQLFRADEITLPLVINDAWTQAV